MTLLGLELSDAGILVAGSEPAGLLKVDGNSVESPGFALPEKTALKVPGLRCRKKIDWPSAALLKTKPTFIPVRFSITSGIN
jgi:hypothetical protein